MEAVSPNSLTGSPSNRQVSISLCNICRVGYFGNHALKHADVTVQCTIQAPAIKYWVPHYSEGEKNTLLTWQLHPSRSLTYKTRTLINSDQTDQSWWSAFDRGDQRDDSNGALSKFAWHRKGLAGWIIIPPVISPTRKLLFPLITYYTGINFIYYPI